MINRLLVLLYTIFASLVFTVFMFLYMPLILMPLIFKINGNRLSYYGLHLWAQSFHCFSGIRYRLRGREHLKAGQSYIFTPNHTSYLDIPALPLIAHHSFKPLSKKEVGNIPVFGLLAKAVTVMVDRSDAEHRRQSIVKLSRALKAGTSLLIFPEGTINKTNKPLTNFYDGAFRIAIETQTPVVPVVIKGASARMPARSWFMRPGLISIEILPPVTTAGLQLSELPELKAYVFSKMEERLAAEHQPSHQTTTTTKKGTAQAMPF